MVDVSDGELKPEDSDRFYCGVLEGFYGRPWSTEQRKVLFGRMQEMGLDTYLYAPKDDCKHRVYWRDLYSVEEAEHLKGLINAAKERNVNFVYALSPGLDMSYSNAKEVTLLKRKLEQVAGFGCDAFALLFDDIDVDMNEADKSIFSSFAQAQVSVTNEVYQHLSQPSVFFFCPTEYCSSRAVPNVSESEYLNTIGSRLLPGIDIFWTGGKVISKDITEEHVEALTKVLRRPPIIWDNIHANDYDQKRVYLGPYVGRSTRVMKKLRGVLSNPNTEFEANYIAMHTLAQWGKSTTSGNATFGGSSSALSEVIRLETEGSDVDPCCPDGYRPQEALSAAVRAWFEEVCKKVDPPPRKMVLAAPPVIVPPQVPVVVPPVVPVPDGCPAVLQNESLMQPVSTVPVNSLLDPSSSSESDGDSAADITDMKCAVVPQISLATVNDPIQSGYDSGVADCGGQEPMKIDCPDVLDMKLAAIDSVPEVLNDVCGGELIPVDTGFTADDLQLVIELFYLPFEHGKRSLELLHQLCWLKAFHTASKEETSPSRADWLSRAENLRCQLSSVIAALNRVIDAPNKAVVQDLFPYVFDVKSMLHLVDTFVSWLCIGNENQKWDVSPSDYPYTWNNKCYSDAFTSGDHEPWVFRGGLQAEFQRVLPLDAVCDLLLPPFPDTPSTDMSRIRTYQPADKNALMSVFKNSDCSRDLPVNVGVDISSEELTEALLDLCADQCFVLESTTDGQPCGFTVAAVNAINMFKKLETEWLPLKRGHMFNQIQPESVDEVEMKVQPYYRKHSVEKSSLLLMHLLPGADVDIFATRRLMACASMGLRSMGSPAVHTIAHYANKQMVDELTLLKFYPVAASNPEISALLARNI